jgi:hypothetical protein
MPPPTTTANMILLLMTSYESDEDSDYHPNDEDEQSLVSIDPLAEPGANEGGNTPDGNNNDSTSDSDDNHSNRDDSGTPKTPLTTYVDALEAKLFTELADLDSTCAPDGNDDESTDRNLLSDDFEPTDQGKIQQATREQAAADMHSPADDSSDDSDASALNGNQREPQPRPRLREHRTPNYAHLKGRDGDGSLPIVARRPHEFGGGRHQAHIILQSIVLTQYNLKQGIQKFGEQGKHAVMTELRQLYGREVMEAVSKNDLTYQEQRGALRYIMFLKEKRCGKLKGRGCADGRPQRAYRTKEDTSSPTVTTEALMLSCMIDATKHRDVATCDIPGAFMQSKMEGKVIMKVEGVMAKITRKSDPQQYKKHTVYKGGKPVIFVILL